MRPRFQIVGLRKHAFVIRLEQSPRFARKKFRKRIAFRCDEGLDRVSDRVEARSRGDASRLRNGERRIEKRDAKGGLRIAARHLRRESLRRRSTRNFELRFRCRR